MPPKSALIAPWITSFRIIPLPAISDGIGNSDSFDGSQTSRGQPGSNANQKSKPPG